MRRVAAYALVLVLALELAVWECWFVPSQPWHLPVSAVAAVVGNVSLGKLGSRWGAVAGPGLCWLVVAITFSVGGPLGDVVVPGNSQGVVFLVAGAASFLWCASKGATPAGRNGR